MAMDSTEFAKLTKKSVGESLEESAAKPPTTEDAASEGTTQSESSNPRRRKGRTPVKNLPPVTKRLSTNAETPADAVGPEAVKKKRGRPRKNHTKVNSDEVMSQNDGGNGNQDEESSQTTGDVSEPLVKRRAVGRSRRGTSNEAESRDQEQVMLHSGLVWVLFKVWLQFYKSKFSDGEREGLRGRPRRE